MTNPLNPDFLRYELANRFTSQRDLSSVEVLDGIEYRKNIHGLRDSSDTAHSDLVVAGCSMTYGIGVPATDTWGFRLKELLAEDSYINLGTPGASAETVARTVMDYVETYGVPKRLAVLMPNLERHYVAGNTSIIFDRNKEAQVKDYTAEYAFDVILDRDNVDRPSYIKKPYLWQDVLPHEHYGLKSLLAIKQLEQYCLAVGIEMIWATWDESLNSLAKSLGFETFKAFDYPFKWSEAACHQDDRAKINERHYSVGADPDRHWGSHTHIHLAEHFYECWKSDND